MDTALFHWINDLAGTSPWLDNVISFYAKYGVVLFAVLLAGSYLEARHRDDIVRVAGTIWAGAAPLVALVVAQAVGRQIDRPRPYTSLQHVHVLVARSTDFSFPSDHATTVGAVAVALLVANRRYGVLAGAAAFAMVFAHVYVGAHYPSDVLAGILIGATVAVIGFRIVVPPFAASLRRVASTGIRPLLQQHAPVRPNPR